MYSKKREQKTYSITRFPSSNAYEWTSNIQRRSLKERRVKQRPAFFCLGTNTNSDKYSMQAHKNVYTVIIESKFCPKRMILRRRKKLRNSRMSRERSRNQLRTKRYLVISREKLYVITRVEKMSEKEPLMPA